MDITKRENTIKIYLEPFEAKHFYCDFCIIDCYTPTGEFVYCNLRESAYYQRGFEVTMSKFEVPELLMDLNYKLRRHNNITRVTKNLIDNLTYFLMSDNQKNKTY